MKRVLKVAAWTVGVLALLVAVLGYPLYIEGRKASSEDPLIWEADIASLTEGTRLLPNLADRVLFVGSSSIRFWSTLEDDMRPFSVVQNGFGGAKLGDIAYYADRLVSDYAPKAVVVFAGTNDIHPGQAKDPQVLLATYRRFVERVRASLPDVPIYFIGITPSRMRWDVWSTAQATNRLIEAYGHSDPALHYIETGPALLGGDGKPDRRNYRIDGLHLSAEGYAIWTRIIRSRLLADLTPLAAGDG